ncbi:hypothetical protein [Amycolatopsis aidingensis]|uniref:hypothetical protein n=1 Tax=Amycolatopsis aidingensis TaxID=2842453 RepID=UPI001C0B894D|nr:hypothetical protein [Amycolatopsis aidingensis]
MSSKRERPGKTTWVRMADHGWVVVHELRDGIGLLPDPYVWYRQQLLFGIPFVLCVVVPLAILWMALAEPSGAGLAVIIAFVGVQGLLLTVSQLAGRRAQNELWAQRGAQPRQRLIFGLLSPWHRLRTVAEMRRNLAARGFTEPVLRARSIAQARVLRHGWTVEVTLRTTKGNEVTLVRRHPLGQRRFLRILRRVLGHKIEPA